VSDHGRHDLRVVLACDFLLRYTTTLAAALDRAGADVALLTRTHDLEFGNRLGAAEAFVRTTAGDGVRHFALAGRPRSARGWAQALQLRREVRRFAPQIVHLQESVVNDPRLPIVAGAWPRRYAATFHDPSPHPGDRAPKRDLLLDRVLARTAGLIFVHSEALRQELAAALRPRAPVVVVPHGAAVVEVAPQPSRPSLLFFGRISHYKGLDVLLDAMGEVWQEVPQATLTIAGEGTILDHPALRDARITVRAGHVPDREVAGFFAAASCVVLPYRQASQSGVGTLAKSHGRPLVVTQVGGLPELVSDGSGLLVPPEDPSRLAAALISVLTDRELARRAGEAGIRTAESEASWDSVAERTLAAYRQFLPGARHL
jgi:alpha-maltose-1-phosphate synthase